MDCATAGPQGHSCQSTQSRRPPQDSIARLASLLLPQGFGRGVLDRQSSRGCQMTDHRIVQISSPASKRGVVTEYISPQRHKRCDHQHACQCLSTSDDIRFRATILSIMAQIPSCPKDCSGPGPSTLTRWLVSGHITLFSSRSALALRLQNKECHAISDHLIRYQVAVRLFSSFG